MLGAELEKNELNYSEMYPHGFNDSSLAWYIRYILNTKTKEKEDDNYLEKIEQILNSDSAPAVEEAPIYEVLSKTKSFSWLKYSLDYSKYFSENDNYDIKMIELSDGKNVPIAEKIKELYHYLFSVSKQRKPLVYSDNVVTEFLNKYFKISQKYIFNARNTNLNNLLFRRSKTLETLNCIGRIPFENKEMAEKGYSTYNICSPYVCDAFQRVVYNMINNQKRLNRIPKLKELRTEIFVTQTIRSFTRFTSYNKFTNYRVSLNRHSGKLISVPYNELSSIEEIKPLRLFEKVVSHISNRLERMTESDRSTDKLNVQVAIIGHTEQSYDKIEDCNNEEHGDNRELADLLRVIVYWYAKNQKKHPEFNYPPLNLSIINLVNKGDIVKAENCDCEASSANDKLKFNIGENVGSVTVEDCDYFAEFYFSKQKLKEICRNYDLMFILDCPWMTVESYELKNRGLLDFYCNSIQNESLRNYQRDVLDSNRRTTMQELDTQYNRITSSDSIKSGDISRIFRDDIIKAVRDYIVNGDIEKRKDMYIFTSEKDGVDYSYLASYPLTRKEIYGEKDFTISHFCNQPSSSLSVENSDVTILIRVWSVLKYIAISYALINLKSEIQSLLSEYDLKPENYFELMRAIVIELKLGSDINQIDIAVRFSDDIDFLGEALNVDQKQLEALKKRIYDEIYPFIYALYSEVVFSDRNDFGDSVIKTGFEMNVISAAQNVNSILFVHFYRLRKANNSTEKFVINWKSEYNPKPINIPQEVHYFKDKRLYEMLLEILQNTSQLNMGTLSTLYMSEEIFQTDNMAERILKNIIESCKKMHYTNNKIYNNALEALAKL